ncbi:hypothetical protein AA106555_0169 [Neokomagataea thailandica NBRC 106555]|uniref:Uncharacterized protein n=1 Tax=Neokomagataea thailandica NBRC 106555 TaxID=1223520 RepID=A0ABQ0QMC6_9PROT|nr:hypothetical protein AA106555_0169 [Neokomagataea thailandica NBRC 106555]
MPELNGSVSVTLPHWRAAAQAALKAEQSRSSLPLDIQEKLNSFFVTSNQIMSQPETPLSVQIQVLRGEPQAQILEFFLKMSTRKIDAKTEEE